MLKYQVLAIRDRQLNAFMRPFFAETIGTGIRAFSDLVNDKDAEPGRHPEDYELWHIAEFDSQTGLFQNASRDGASGPQQVAIATNLLKTPR